MLGWESTLSFAHCFEWESTGLCTPMGWDSTAHCVLHTVLVGVNNRTLVDENCRRRCAYEYQTLRLHGMKFCISRGHGNFNVLVELLLCSCSIAVLALVPFDARHSTAMPAPVSRRAQFHLAFAFAPSRNCACRSLRQLSIESKEFTENEQVPPHTGEFQRSIEIFNGARNIRTKKITRQHECWTARKNTGPSSPRIVTQNRALSSARTK